MDDKHIEKTERGFIARPKPVEKNSPEDLELRKVLALERIAAALEAANTSQGSGGSKTVK